MQPSVDIQNLLLGLSGLPVDLPSTQDVGVLSEFGTPVSSDAAQPLFRDVLGLLVGGQRLNPTKLADLPMADTAVSEATALGANSPAADLWFDSVLSSQFSPKSGANNATVEQMNPGIGTPMDAKGQQLVQSPEQSIIADNIVNGLMMTEAILLEPGKYEVLSARVEGDQFEIVIRPDSLEGQEITLRLPVDALKGAVRQSGGADRVMINDVPGQSLKDMLVNLKATTIEIKEAPASDAETLTELEIKLATNTDGRANVLRLQVSREDVQAKTTLPLSRDTQANDANAKLGTESGDENSNDGFRRQNGSHQDARAAVPVGKDLISAPFDLSRLQSRGSASRQFVESIQAEPMTGTNGDTLSTYMNQAQPSDAGSSSQSAQGVRLVIPDHLTGHLKTNGQSVMIRVEPDNLGPARLNLSLRGNTLTARVTVETPQARAAVESSVDQLVDQLARAGIKVSQVQVAVDGGGLRNQFFDRQSVWHRPKTTQRAGLIDGTELEQTTTPIVSDPYAAQYIGREGVNLFA